MGGRSPIPCCSFSTLQQMRIPEPTITFPQCRRCSIMEVAWQGHRSRLCSWWQLSSPNFQLTCIAHSNGLLPLGLVKQKCLRITAGVKTKKFKTILGVVPGTSCAAISRSRVADFLQATSLAQETRNSFFPPQPSLLTTQHLVLAYSCQFAAAESGRRSPTQFLAGVVPLL